MRKLFWGLAILAIIGASAFLFGPRVNADTVITFDPSSIGTDLNAYLAKAEAGVSGIHDNLHKQIVWAYPASKAKTPLSIVYVHGFSASMEEIRPVPDKVAAALGANLYFTRLTGHGQDGAALAEATVKDWANDIAEALALGKMLGEKVIVIGTSTGAGLATWAANDPKLKSQIDALIFVSPNYGVQAGGSWLLTMPFGEQLANLIVGPERSFETINDMHARFWTWKYPTKALLPMAALTKLAVKTRVEDIKQPVLMIYSEDDKVIRPDLLKAVGARWGGGANLHPLAKNDDPFSHVIAGAALSPSTTDETAQIMVDWLKTKVF